MNTQLLTIIFESESFKQFKRFIFGIDTQFWQAGEIKKHIKQTKPSIRWFILCVIFYIHYYIGNFGTKAHHIKIQLKNRFFHRWYVVDTKLPKYEYHEVDDRMMWAIFSLFMYYVEEDCHQFYSVISSLSGEKDQQNENMGVQYLYDKLNETHDQSDIDMITIYNYIKHERKTLEQTLYTKNGMSWDQLCDRDDEILTLIIKNRRRLWV